MSPTEATQPPRIRILHLITVMLACLWAPTDLIAQTKADRESVNRVVELLFLAAGEYQDEVARHPGTWSVVIARFAKGDMREIEIRARIGESYQVEGASDSIGTDVDICVYGPDGARVECDTLEDNVPIVTFTTETGGVYRAVMTAAAVEGGGTAYAGMVVLRLLQEGERGGDGGR